MGKKMPYYRCKNSSGDNPCKRALSGELIPETEAVRSFDGNPKCPGETSDGKPCEKELVYVCDGPEPGRTLLDKLKNSLTSKPVLIAGGGVVALLLLALILMNTHSFTQLFHSGTSRLSVVPDTLIFPFTKSGVASAAIHIRNDGNGELTINSVEVHPSEFSVPHEKVNVTPKHDANLLVRFRSTSTEMANGELVLHSNDKKSPAITIKLIANRDPWWVYRKLDTTSKILRKGP